ncbi:MAG: putative Metallo-beta-lactamase superfamily, partial [Verrucomicrobia bacterium]|nr:putative Metallo-beta-lactamase superfamily [Verrucomicrobiota bacterium]
MKWPLAPVVLCLAAGIVAGDVLGVHWAAVAALAAGLTFVCVWKKHARSIALGTLLFLGGWVDLLGDKEVFSARDLHVVLTPESHLATIEGTLAEAPRERFVETKRGTESRFSSLIDVQRIQLKGEWKPAEGRVFVQTPAAPPLELHRGRQVQVKGNLGVPEPPSTPDMLDFREYLAHQDIHFQMHTRGLEDWHLAENGSRKAAPLSDRFRDWAMVEFQGNLPPGDQNVMLLQAMGLGWKAGLMDDVAKPFMQSGTLHVFAISGLHVALIAVMLVALLHGVGVPRRVCGAVLIPLLWFYTAATGWQASAVRSAIMMSVIGAGWMLERPSNMLNSLAAAAAIILVWDPQQLFQPGFQLSFMVVLSMGLLIPPVEEWRKRIFRPDPLLPEELRPRWQRWFDEPVRWITMNAVTSFAAWLGSLPLIAYYFKMITPVSLLANLVLVPLSSLALMSSFGSLLLAWCPPIAELFNLAAWLLMKWMVASSIWFAELPAAWWPVIKPGPGIFLSFYTLVLSLFAVQWKSPWRWRLAAVAGVTLISLLGVGWQTQRESIRLTVLDVNGGDAHVFEGGRHFPSLIIDAGSDAGYENALNTYLQSRARRSMPQLLVTHGDVRHVGGAPLLIKDYDVTRLITSPVTSRSPGYRDLVREWSTNSHEHLIITNGSRLGPWEVLHPAATDKFPSGDDNAVVLRGEIRGVRVLLLSDLGRSGQRVLLERHQDLRADIVVTGIPAKEEPLMDDLLAAIAPQVVIVTCALQPATEQARPELRERLKQGPWAT